MSSLAEDVELVLGPFRLCPSGSRLTRLATPFGPSGRKPLPRALHHYRSVVPTTLSSASLLRVELARIRAFRGLDECVLSLDPRLTLLAGRNNSGKSRVLRAVALACGGVIADRDDFTVGSDIEPEIDIVIAPGGDGASGFDPRVIELFGTNVQLVSAAGDQRIAWRTTVTRSAEGWGARASSRFLAFDAATNDWRPVTGQAEVGRNHRNALSADLVSTGRDLAAELSRPGSAIRRVLDDLEVPDDLRAPLEAALQELGGRIVDESAALGAIRDRLGALGKAVGGVGDPDVSALPGRLEELVRMIEIALDTGSGALPMRMHGSGARSLTSLQVQSVLYDRRIGRDGSDFPTHPVTLLEEPEAHLHPQACFDLADLLDSIPGQVLVSTHSSHLVSVAEPSAIRLIRHVSGATQVHDMSPVDGLSTRPPALRLDVAAAEWEKIKRFVERPFGEVLFASAIVIGDGASERAFLPYLLRHALGLRGAEVCVVDPGAMSQSDPLIKYAEAAGIPCVAFLDADQQGRDDEKSMRPYAKRVWATGDSSIDGALEEVLTTFNEDWVVECCKEHLSAVEGSGLERLKRLKGTYGSSLGRSFVQRFPDPASWPQGFQDLLDALSPRPEESDGNAR